MVFDSEMNPVRGYCQAQKTIRGDMIGKMKKGRLINLNTY